MLRDYQRADFLSMLEITVQALQKVTVNWLLTVQEAKDFDVTITEDGMVQYIFHREQRDFLRLFFINTEALQAAEMEQKHHGTGRYDTFLCIPPLYHTGAREVPLDGKSCGRKQGGSS